MNLRAVPACRGRGVRATADVVVVGAGVLGCSVAYELARRGLAVCVVDRGSGPGQGSTSASSAIIRFNYSTWTGVATAWESAHAWLAWEDHLEGSDDGALAQFVRTGGLCLDSPGQDRAGVLRLFDRAGVPYEEWDAAQLAARMPWLDRGSLPPAETGRRRRVLGRPVG